MVAMVVAIRLFLMKNMVRYPTSSQKGWDSQIVLVWLPHGYLLFTNLHPLHIFLFVHF
jgi:hypothetical protein